jgi:hypothetical protein
VRKIVDQPFPSSTATSLNFQLSYPANSQLVAVVSPIISFNQSTPHLHLTHIQVSDQSGFGSGGTSVAAQVLTSNDASCFNPASSVSPQFVFSIEPPNQIVQCTPTRIWWDKSTVQGSVPH